MHIYHGTVICCDSAGSIASYLVEDKGRILFVGNTLPEAYRPIPVIALGERALLPAFADTHLHFSSFALFHGGINVSDLKSNGEILQHLALVHEDSKEEIVIGFGLSPHSVREGRMLNREELDTVLPDYPVFMVKYDGHACVINTVLLRMLPEDLSGLRGYNGETGEMGQEAFFAVTDYITGSISPVRLIKNLLEAYDYMTSQGFGLMHTAAGVGFPRDLDVDVERWVARGIRSGFQTRLFFQTRNTDKVHRRKLPRIGGCFGTALDGCFGSMDAALYQPYEGTEERGVLYFRDDEVVSFCKKANREGLQIALHAIGDAAFDQAARALHAALEDYPRDDHRHEIIHACLPTDEGMDLCARRGIHIPLQPAFLDWPQEPSSYLRRILGKREEALQPLKTMWNRGLLLSGGSDAPCTAPNAIHGIHCACNHPSPSESLPVMDALKLFTINGYKSSFDEADRGSLEPGKIADMVVLSENPLEIPVEKLNSLQVENILLQGKEHPPHNHSPILTGIKGLLSRGQI